MPVGVGRPLFLRGFMLGALWRACQIDPLIRNLTEYRDVVRHITEGDTP